MVVPRALAELRRELRWAGSSRTLWVLIVAAALCTAWAVSAGISSTQVAVARCELTVAQYQENGVSIAEAVHAPADVSGPADSPQIGNPLRYDLDAASLAATQLSGTGAIAAALSLACLLFLPLIGFCLGLFVATHDARSGSVLFRWPYSGLAGFWAGKVLFLVATLIAVVLLLAAMAGIAGGGTALWGAQPSPQIAAFAVPGPTAGQVVLLACFAALIGVVSALVGLMVGALTLNRTISLTVYALAYYLLPVLGPADPRDALIVAGGPVLYFVGQFQPQPLGHEGAVVACCALAAIGVASALIAAVPWRWRAHRAVTL